MPGEDVIDLEGAVTEVLKQGKLFQVGLANGHRLLGHVPLKWQQAAAGIGLGDKVNLKVSPCDFSHGRIVLETKKK
jgi:translation initiation factor IF-1